MFPEATPTTVPLSIVAYNECIGYYAGGEEEYSDGAEVCGALVSDPHDVQL